MFFIFLCFFSNVENFKIAVCIDNDIDKNFKFGIDLAVKQFKEKYDFFDIEYFNHNTSIEKAISITDIITKDPSYFAVIDRSPSNIAIPILNMYEKKFFFPTCSRHTNLTKINNKLVNRIIPNSKQICEKILNFLKSLHSEKIDNILILYVKNDYGDDAANTLEDMMRLFPSSINLVTRYSYYPLIDETSIYEILKNWELFDFDGVVMFLNDKEEFEKFLKCFINSNLPSVPIIVDYSIFSQKKNINYKELYSILPKKIELNTNDEVYTDYEICLGFSIASIVIPTICENMSSNISEIIRSNVYETPIGKIQIDNNGQLSNMDEIFVLKNLNYN